MDQQIRRKKKIQVSRPTSYARLHGVPPSDKPVSLNTSASLPTIQAENKPRVHFSDDLYQQYDTGTTSVKRGTGTL